MRDLTQEVRAVAARLNDVRELKEQLQIVVADQELKRQSDLVRSHNDQLSADLAALRSREHELQRELHEKNRKIEAHLEALNAQQTRISEMERELGELKAKNCKSQARGAAGEQDLLALLDRFAATYPDFAYKFTGKVKHSGDVVLSFPVRKRVPGGKSAFHVLLDRKNYSDDAQPNHVQTAHVKKAVSDAKGTGCDAVVVVYNRLSDRYNGICEYEDMSSRYEDPMDPCFVKACAFDSLWVALSKLLFDFTPLGEEQRELANSKESLRHAEVAWLSLMDIVAPILKSIDVKKIDEAARQASASMIEAKRYLSLLPTAHGAQLLSLLSQFQDRSAGSRGGKMLHVVGPTVPTLTAQHDARKRALVEAGAEQANMDDVDGT